MPSRTHVEYPDLLFAPSTFRAVLPPYTSIVNGTARVGALSFFLAISTGSRMPHCKDLPPNFNVQKNLQRKTCPAALESYCVRATGSVQPDTTPHVGRQIEVFALVNRRFAFVEPALRDYLELELALTQLDRDLCGWAFLALP